MAKYVAEQNIMHYARTFVRFFFVFIWFGLVWYINSDGVCLFG